MEIRKLKTLLLEVQPYAIVAKHRLDNWELKVAKFEGIDQYVFEGSPRTISPGAAWGAMEAGINTGFLRKVVTIPAGMAGYPVELQVISGGEAQVFIDDKPYQGNDPNHFRVLLSECCEGGERYDLKIESWIRHAMNAIGEAQADAGSTGVFSQAELVAFDPEARSFLRDIEFALNLAEAQPSLAPRIKTVMTEILTSFDVTDRGGFLAGVSINAARLAAALEAIPLSADPVTVWMLGQSHLDVAWFWRTSETYRKVIRTFSSVLRYMDRYPFYRFMMPQVKLYRMAAQSHPPMLEQIRERIGQGRWEVSGMMYLEPDTNLIGGEWLVRNLLLGRDVCSELGAEVRVESLIDAFGYSGNLPQIFARSGVDSVVLTKMMWYNDTNKFPYSAFNWRGIDGTSVLVATMPLFNRPCTPQEVAANVDQLKQKEVVRDVPVFFGWGDGGGGADDNHLDMLERDIKWYRPDRVHAGRLDQFFRKLFEVREKLPSWWGEVYQEGHRGCYTSQARHKQCNRASEGLYRSLEWLMSLDQWQGGPAAQDQLKENIELIVTNQFHDTLSGSGANRIYDDAQKDYAKIIGQGKEMRRQTLARLESRIDTQGQGQAIVVWNLHGFNSPAMVELDWSGQASGTLVSPSGKETLHAISGGKLRFVADELVGFGHCVYRFLPTDKPAATASPAISKRPTQLENGRFIVAWNSSGGLTRIFDKRANREVLNRCGLGNRLVLYLDYPQSCDAWDIDADYRQHGKELKAESIHVHAPDGLSQRVTFQYRTERSTIRQSVVLHDGLDRIEFVTAANWHERHRLLRAHFDVDLLAPMATYDIPFGAIQRDTQLNNTWQQAKFEVPALSVADLSEPDYGVALLSQHKNGFMVRESDMSISLLRSPMFPDEQADQGEHTFSYSIMPHLGTFASGGVVAASRLLVNQPVAHVADSHPGKLPSAMSLLQVEPAEVVVETLKAAHDGQGLVLRMYEARGQHEKVNVKFALPLNTVQECNLMEDPEAAADFKDGCLKVSLRPFEIKTFRLK